MTNQPSQSVEELAQEYYLNTLYCEIGVKSHFIAGYQHAMRSAQVKGLVEALTRIATAYDRMMSDEDALDISRMDIIATEALKQFKGG